MKNAPSRVERVELNPASELAYAPIPEEGFTRSASGLLLCESAFQPDISLFLRTTWMHLEFTPDGVLFAYRRGIFPMSNSEIDVIQWYRPDPRAILPLDGFHASHSLAKTIRRGRFEVRFNSDFEGVMRACAVREEGTWITEDFIELYATLHRKGKAHSVEVLLEGRLVGGTYGVAIGGAFMAESMFHFETDASKVAISALVQRLNERAFKLLDVQYQTSHLMSLGVIEIPRQEYYQRLKRAVRLPCKFE